MPITKSVKKALRRSDRKAIFNIRRKRAMKESVKTVRNLAHEKNFSGASENLSLAYQAIDKAAKRGVIKKNTAARKKSRLAKLISAK